MLCFPQARSRMSRAARGAGLLLAAGLALFARPSPAYETDQLTNRNLALPDALSITNRHMDEVLRTAVDATNQKTGCSLGLERSRQILADHIHRLTGGSKLVWSRGPLRMSGFSKAGGWAETAPVGKRLFHLRYDIFGDLSLRESVILRVVGPCATLRVAGQLIGTDKFDHFFELGYDYYVHSRWGADPDAGLAWGTSTERTYFGTLTSRTFSFADLRANYDGFLFFLNLLEPGSVVEMGDDGCVHQTRPWSWEDWITWEYDEVLNPSVYAPIVQTGITRTLEERRDALCAEYAQWGGPEYQAHLDDVLASWPPYVAGPAPARSDPYQLERLCHGDALWSGTDADQGAN